MITLDGEVNDILTNRYRELSDLGIGVPPLIRLFQELRKRDAGIDRVPLTVKEGRAILQKTLENRTPLADIAGEPERADGKPRPGGRPSPGEGAGKSETRQHHSPGNSLPDTRVFHPSLGRGPGTKGSAEVQGTEYSRFFERKRDCLALRKTR